MRHRLRNSGDRAVACAAWAITQLSPGGTAIMPQPPIDPQTDEVLADRSLVIWPYTDPTASEIHIGRDAVTISGSDSPAKAKLGQTNRRGWVAYVLGGTAFIKWSIRHRDDLEYVDLGASVQVYRDDRFVELESLSPLRTLQPGGSLDHVELWQLLEVSGIDDDRLLDLGPDPTGEWL